MKKNIISFLVCVIFITTPVLAKAQEAEIIENNIVSIDRGQKAPFSGILMDPNTAAKINVDKKYSLLEGQLKLDYEIKKLTNSYELKLGLLQTRFDTLKIQTDSTIKYKNEEISRLQELVKEDPNDYTHWWLMGGIVVGILTSIGIFYASVEVSK